MGAPKGNKYALNNEGGRPLKYKNVEEMQKLIDAYFDSCYEEIWVNDKVKGWIPVLDRFGNVRKEQVKPFSVTGLALAIGTSRETLLEYQNREEFIDAIKAAKLRIESYAEESLYTLKNPAGVIFSLKNNYGWKDKQDIEVTNGDAATSIQAARERAKKIDTINKENQLNQPEK
jgi:hypothetical protein